MGVNFNGFSEDEKLLVAKGMNFNKVYMQYNEDKQAFFFNDRLPKLELYNYLTYQEVYKNGISLAKHYEEVGAIPELHRFQKIKDDIEAASITPSFKDVYLEFSKFKKEHSYIGVVSAEIEALLVWQPLVKDAYYQLGDEKVKQLRYTVSKVEDALDALDESKTQDNKIASILGRKLHPGFISSRDTKTMLRNAYKVVGKDEYATASDIKRWYEADDKVKTLNGKSVRGFIIIKPKFLFDAS